MSARRFLNGITNVSSADPLGAVPYLDPTKWVVYHEDFCGPFLGTAAGTVANGSSSNVGGGYYVTASTNATISGTTDATDAPLGCLSIVTTAADNEYGYLQTGPGWAMTAGKKFVMEIRFEITAATIAQNELFLGLASWHAVGATFFATDGTARAFDDGIGWYSPDADADIDVIVGENDVFDNQTVIATYVTATWYTCSLYYDGADIHLWINGTSVGSMTPAQIPVSAVGPTIWFKTGEAAVQTFLCDYIYIAAER